MTLDEKVQDLQIWRSSADEQLKASKETNAIVNELKEIAISAKTFTKIVAFLGAILASSVFWTLDKASKHYDDLKEDQLNIDKLQTQQINQIQTQINDVNYQLKSLNNHAK